MHEVIRTASRLLVCDICGMPIQPGENFRYVWDEYNPTPYYEHIQCPLEPTDKTPIAPFLANSHTQVATH